MDPARNKRNANRALLAIVVLLAVELGLYLHERSRLSHLPLTPPPTANLSGAATNSPPAVAVVQMPAPATNAAPGVTANPLQDLLNAVKDAPDAKTARQRLA